MPSSVTTSKSINGINSEKFWKIQNCLTNLTPTFLAYLILIETDKVQANEKWMSEILSFTEHNWTVLPLLHKWFQIVVYRIRSNVVQNLNKQSLGNPVCGLGVCDQSQSIIYSLFASWIWMCIVFQGAVFWSVIMHTLSGRYTTVGLDSRTLPSMQIISTLSFFMW